MPVYISYAQFVMITGIPPFDRAMLDDARFAMIAGGHLRVCLQIWKDTPRPTHTIPNFLKMLF